MADPLTLEQVEQIVAQLSAEDRFLLAARLTEQLRVDLPRNAWANPAPATPCFRLGTLDQRLFERDFAQERD